MRSNMINEAGHQYGNLIVIEPASLPNRNKMGWRCKCLLCGNENKIISGSDLRAGKYTSCGCKKQNITKEKPGTIYGYLKVIKQDPKPAKEFPDHLIHWICECQLCHSICSISGRKLRNGTTQSCGCVHSYGELIINQYLNNNNIPFQKEYKFQDLKDKTYLRFDFAIFNNDNNIIGLIEFNGLQHYREKSFETSKDSFQNRIKHDNIKIKYCKEKQIPLYIIQNPKQKSKKYLNKHLPIILENILIQLKENKNNGKIFNINI